MFRAKLYLIQINLELGTKLPLLISQYRTVLLLTVLSYQVK